MRLGLIPGVLNVAVGAHGELWERRWVRRAAGYVLTWQPCGPGSRAIAAERYGLVAGTGREPIDVWPCYAGLWPPRPPVVRSALVAA